MTLHYDFPHSITLNEVRDLVKDNDDFIIVDKGDYVVANYVRQGNDTFPTVTGRDTAILRELRGLIFDKATGHVVSRRYQKFFNLGEREDIANLDITKPHMFLEKLDGSMITPFCFYNGTVKWMSKMGMDTDVALLVEAHVIDTTKKHDYNGIARHLWSQGFTPIFEFCSRKNRIVIDYPEDQLVLVAIRRNYDGSYTPYDKLKAFATLYDIPVVKAKSYIGIGTGKPYDLDEVVANVRAFTDQEGIVIRFEDGHMVKIKADAYVTLHRAKSLLDNERDVVATILDNKVDDLYAILDIKDKRRLTQFARMVQADIDWMTAQVKYTMSKLEFEEIERKTFALMPGGISQAEKMFVFKHWPYASTGTIKESVEGYVRSHLGSTRSYEKLREVLLTSYRRWKETYAD